MKKFNNIILIFIVAITMISCSDDENIVGPDNETEEASSEKQFVYNGMNEWYLYRNDVADLADDRFENDAAFQQYLMNFTDASTLFSELQIPNDPYSFFIEDYEEYEQEQDGIRAALGFNYGFIGFQNSNDIVGYIRYIIPDSPADEADLQRLDLFTKVDGTDLTRDNYRGILREDGPHDLTLAEIDTSGQSVSFNETETVTVESEQVQENPIFKDTLITRNNTQIGYLMYNAFQGNSHEDLNQVIGNFESSGIDELVLDLRYNGGGAVISSQTLASMISGLDSTNTFANFSYNDKKSQLDNTDHFLNEVPLQNEEGEFERNNQGQYTNTIPMNTLSGIDQLYVLTSRSTASASEALINGLRPYMDVILIGETTEGKDVGSITLYDAPPEYSNKDNINSDHKKAIQPIVVSITNSENNNYSGGFTPNHEASELTAENLMEKPAIGSSDEPLLGAAISLITGESTAKTAADKTPSMLRSAEILMNDTELRPHDNVMYIEPSMLPAQAKK